MTEQKQWAEKVIKETCEEIPQISEEIIRAVFSDQWKRARVAQKTCNEIEFAAFGKFAVLPHRIKKQIEKFEGIYKTWSSKKETETDPNQIRYYERRIRELLPQLESLKNRKKKLDEDKS
jgi:hypothetical protein